MGVQLIDKLPGKIVKKRIKRKRRSVRRRQERKISNSSLPARQNPENTIVGENGAIEKERIPMNEDNEKMIDTGISNTSSTEEKMNDETIENNTITQAGPESETVYYTDDEIECDSSGNSRPSPPSNSMFSCFHKRSSVNKKDTKNKNKSLNDEYDVDHQRKKVDHKLDIEQCIDDDAFECNLNGDEYKNRSSEDDDRSVYDYFEEEEDVEEDLEYPVTLFLGEDGQIGTIDIRFIGKELHVMVEEAIIPIEIVPISPDDTTFDTVQDDEFPDDDNTKRRSTSDDTKNDDVSEEEENNNNDDKSANASSDKKQQNGKTKPSKERKRDTVGDRVLADNVLARIISAIPHLFLRDIQIRFIVRDEPMTRSEYNTRNVHNYTKPRSSSKDVMVDLGIDFLSVDSGEDVFSYFQNHTTEDDAQIHHNLDGNNGKLSASSDTLSITKPPSLVRIPSTNIDDTDIERNNEYLIRNIKTGRGPSAGVNIQFFLPNSRFSKIATRNAASSGMIWARQHWISSTENYLLNVSGVDISARIHMGTKKIDAGYSWFYSEYDDEEEDESDYDSIILFGGALDAIAPGPQLPLPPIQSRMNNETVLPDTNSLKSAETENVGAETSASFLQPTLTTIYPGSDVYHQDSNGIQSCNIPSIFHRISRGMELKSCNDCKKLPSEVCDLCWEAPNSNIRSESSLDSTIPMPGLALQINIRDPLEINLDRNNLELIGLIKDIIVKPDPSSKKIEPDKESSAETDPTVNEVESFNTEEITRTTVSYGKKENVIKEEEFPDYYANYMQPENIIVLGAYFSEIIIRVQVMREDKDDRDLSFCYWQIETNCLTIDRQSLNAPEKKFQDLELDIGQVVWNEYRGTEKKNVVSLGLIQMHKNRQRCESYNTASSMIDDHTRNKVPWPSTACALLDIPPPIESLAYKNREGHGLQCRFISIPNIHGREQALNSSIHLRFGITTVDSTFVGLRKDVSRIAKEIINKIVGKPKETVEVDNVSSENLQKNNEDNTHGQPNPSRSLTTYTVQVDSTNISLAPLLKVKMPMTCFHGEISSFAGFSIEAILNKCKFSYGEKEPSVNNKRCLSLPQIAQLPENARMHILFCLQDFSSLSKAFNVKEKNSFRLIKAVDKAMLKMSKKISKKSKNESRRNSNHAPIKGGTVNDHNNRRQRILTEIMKMDDSELTNLWSVHQRYQKRLAKKSHISN